MQLRIAAAVFCTFALTSTAPAQTETVRHNFSAHTGETPYAGLIADRSGNFYGTTYEGSRNGAVYRLDSGGRYSVLHSFSGPDGDSPYGTLARDSGGNFYGTTSQGGLSNAGVIFKLDTGGLYSILYTFTGGSDGGTPMSGVSLDAAGNLYGTTFLGGAHSLGVVYELNSGGQYSVLHSFAGTPDGASPYAGVARDSAGNLYGTTFFGGSGRAPVGVVYKVDPSGNETVLHSFTGGVDGAEPFGGLSIDSAGNLYGTASFGGASNQGVVFRIDPSGNETVLHSFTGADGASPAARPTLDSSGNLYGTTEYGGASGDGVVYKIDRNTHQESVLYSFTGVDGSTPYAPVLIMNGNFYGTTLFGGAYGDGVLFQITPAP